MKERFTTLDTNQDKTSESATGQARIDIAFHQDFDAHCLQWSCQQK